MTPMVMCVFAVVRIYHGPLEDAISLLGPLSAALIWDFFFFTTRQGKP